MDMKVRSLLFVAAAFLAGACTDEESFMQPASPAEGTVRVPVTLEAAVQTDTSLEPMTRATYHKEWFSNVCRVLILKRSDTRWIVDTTLTVRLDPRSGPWDELKVTDFPPCSFDAELRPGAYRFVAILNWQVAKWNSDLLPGRVVADDADASVRTPSLIVYNISTHPANTGYRMLNREVFVAVADLTVPRADDLHGTAIPPVELRAERRVGKLRILLKNTPSPREGFTFEPTAHTLRLLLTAQEKPFPEGIDALGGMYYGDTGLYELPWCMSTIGTFHAAESGEYQMCQTNSTVFSPFLFADPAGELAFTVSGISIAGASGGFTYKTGEVFDRTLAASRIDGIVFRTTDVIDNSSSQKLVDVTEACDAEGRPENAATLFDEFYEWNAASN